MKVVEICSHKLVYALPFDCEPIYYALSIDEDKTKARELISSQRGTLLDQGDAPVYPTVDKLFEALGHVSLEAMNSLSLGSRISQHMLAGMGRRPVKTPEKVNILNSWLSSVPNPSFTFEEVVKLLGDFHDDAEDDVKQGNRLEVLQLVHGIMESPLSVDQVKELLQLYTNHQRRLDTLIIVAEKMVFQTLWQLVEIIRMFKTSTHRTKVRSVLDSVKCNQQPIDQPQRSPNLHEGILLKAIELLLGYTESINVVDFKQILRSLGHSQIDEKLRAVEICADKLVYDHISDFEAIYEECFYHKEDEARELIEAHIIDVPGERKKVRDPTVKELLDAVKEAAHGDEKMNFLQSWAASVPFPVICVNDYEELLKYFPTEKDTVASILGHATYFRPRLGLRVWPIGKEATNRQIVSFGDDLLREKNLLLTPWDLAVEASCFTDVEGKMKLIEFCAPYLEYDDVSDCDVIYKCIPSEENKAMAKKLVETSKDASLLRTFMDQWYKDIEQMRQITVINDLRFELMVISEDEFWKWLKVFHFEEHRDDAYGILVKKIVPPPSWA
ncbi:hypothetical protein GEMRC1_005724 [Eukaryota sp. GEM-RC1]